MSNNAGMQKVHDLLDAIKTEYDTLSQQASVLKNRKIDYESSVITSQIQEMQQIQHSLSELETQHKKMKESYEEEIASLKKKLESKNNETAGLSAADQHLFGNDSTGQATRPQLQAQPYKPVLSQPGTAAFQASTQKQPVPYTAIDGSSAIQSIPTVQPLNHPQGVDSLGNPQPGQGTVPGAATFSSGGAFQQDPSAATAAANLPPGGPMTQPVGPGAATVAQGAFYNNNANTNPSSNNNVITKLEQTPSTPAEVPAPSAHVAAVGNPVPPSNAADVNPQQQQRQPSPAASAPIDRRMSLDERTKESGQDWYAVYNEKMPKRMSIGLVHTLEHKSVVCCVRFSADGKYLATGCNRAAEIFDVQTGQKLATFEQENTNPETDLYIRSVAFSPDGKYLVTGAEDRQIRMWDIATGKVKHVFVGHEQDIYSLDYSRDGRYIVSGSGDHTARLWEAETGKCVLTLAIENGVTAVAFSPNNQFIAAGSLDQVIRVWSITGTLLKKLEGHRESVYSIAFSADGKYLASGSLDKTMRLWELKLDENAKTCSKASAISTYTGHSNFVLSVAISPNGKWAVSGSKDRSVQFWNLKTDELYLTFQGHKNSVISVCFSPDGKLFATGSGDLRARIWSIEDTA
ncbi:transcriptional corepressor Tup11 [Schizosaccharomyces japonicus yFS275]|uniref:Transcriptional corepressor Tup11 n=2 Tax=Schizosaccharomyces japonicus TaxID=4897 RepID=B6JV84_SCHJY|nr:transcriptional corepressor Tup11 [Schizosaccharomyces japonicus yFS275]ACZ97558.1 Tup11 protein [Schizosaccharomyces japonicus]EEB05285.1 transcriptional corepressor Tup11 [Schizosaccharomyces japonicus yFS275]